MIGIKGMEMPENCLRCAIGDVSVLPSHSFCRLTATTTPFVVARRGKAENCPLVEVANLFNDAVIDIEYECCSCHGTGLYRGACECDGAAVVCRSCGGTGKGVFRAEPFTGRKIADGVVRVFDSSHGYFVTSKDVITKDGVELPFSQWGCTYEDWLNGAIPLPMKGLVCPYNHYNQNIENEPLGDKCRKGIPGFGLIFQCIHYKDKEKCWEELEQDTGKLNGEETGE